jgi:hypothetical protein
VASSGLRHKCASIHRIIGYKVTRRCSARKLEAISAFGDSEMLSRALSLAAVTLLIGGFLAKPALAQVQNLEAGKSPSQIFAGTCTACHKGPRGLLKTVAASSLPGFLRQHYTTSSEMASLLAGFLVSNGAADTRYVGQPKGRDDKSEARLGGAPDQLDRFGRRLRPARQDAEPREAAKPDTAALPESPQVGRNGPRWTRPVDPAGAESQDPAQAANERGPDGRRLSTKQKLSKRAKPGGEDAPKTDAANTEAGKEESPKSEAAQSDTPKIETPKNETARVGDDKPEGAKPSAGESKSEPATGNSEPPALRADPVPQVTPAPAVAAAVSSGSPETSAVLSPVQSPPQTLTASAPPAVPPAGPPAPPISR